MLREPLVPQSLLSTFEELLQNWRGNLLLKEWQTCFLKTQFTKQWENVKCIVRSVCHQIQPTSHLLRKQASSKKQAARHPPGEHGHLRGEAASHLAPPHASCLHMPTALGDLFEKAPWKLRKLLKLVRQEAVCLWAQLNWSNLSVSNHFAYFKSEHSPGGHTKCVHN